jgi:hypothetical protein
MRASYRWTWLVLPLLVWGCARQETEEAPEVAVTPEQIRTLVMEEIHAVGDTITLAHPKTSQPVNLALVAVHEDVMETPGGRRLVCVDFMTPDSVVFDVDYYLTSRNGSWVVTDVVVHRLGEEVVLAETDRARLAEVK